MAWSSSASTFILATERGVDSRAGAAAGAGAAQMREEEELAKAKANDDLRLRFVCCLVFGRCRPEPGVRKQVCVLNLARK